MARNKIRQSVPERVLHAFIMFLLILIGFITLYPFWHVIMYSLSDSKAAMSGGLFFYPRQPTLLAYSTLLKTNQVFVAYKNSLIVTVCGTLLSMLVTSMLAYPLSLPTVKGRRIISGMIFFTMLFSGGMIPTFLVVKSLGLLDTLWALMIPGCVSAYNLFILRNNFQAIPGSLYESARIDGASPFRIFWQIAIPLSKPALAAVSMFYAVNYWNSYVKAVLYINRMDLQILQQYLRNVLGAASAIDSIGSSSDYNAANGLLTEESVKMVTIAVSIIPMLIIYPWLQKYYVKGSLLGAVKE